MAEYASREFRAKRAVPARRQDQAAQASGRGPVRGVAAAIQGRGSRRSEAPYPTGNIVVHPLLSVWNATRLRGAGEESPPQAKAHPGTHPDRSDRRDRLDEPRSTADLVNRSDPPVIQRLLIGGVQYRRTNGGTVVGQPETRLFGANQEGPVPIEQPDVMGPDVMGIVANVPTIGNVSQVATTYAQGWQSPQVRRQRQRLVVGVNSYQSLGETEQQARERVNSKVDAVDESTVGTALLFVWRPNWTVNNQPAGWPDEHLELSPQEKAAEKKEALTKEGGNRPDESMVPYGLIRSTILSSTPTSTYAEAFRQAHYQPYVHVGDPDASSLRVPVGKSRPAAGQPGEFAQESNVALFDRLQQLIQRRREVKHKPLPSVVAGGYQLRQSSVPGRPIPFSEIASQIDMQVRRVLFSKGLTGVNQAAIRGSPFAAYLPEPNLLVRWSDIPKAAGGPEARAGLFGAEKNESPTLMRNLVEALRNPGPGRPQGFTLAEIRQRIAFKPAASIGTGATNAGERFLVAGERSPAAEVAHHLRRDDRPANVEAAYRQILTSGQSHANPEHWAEKAIVAANVNQPPSTTNANKRTRRANLNFARNCLRNATNNEGPAFAARNAIIPKLGNNMNVANNNLNLDQQRKLIDLATQTVAVISSYQDAITAALEPH